MNFLFDNNGIDELFKFILRLVEESERRFEDANRKVAKYMFRRVKSCQNSLSLLQMVDTSFKKSISKDRWDKLCLVEKHLIELVFIWEQKFKTDKPQTHDFSKYHATPALSGKCGRPPLEISLEQIIYLRDYHFNWSMIANILGVHRTTLWRKLKQLNFNFDQKYSVISDENLDKEVFKIKELHPLAGEKMVIGFLRANGIHLQRYKIRQSIHRVDPLNAINRWLQKNPRWVYSVPGPNSLWHNDGLHKLIHWGIIVHACIDGYSRLVTSLLCATNNYAKTALTGFLQGVKSFGLPARVRGDKGGENVGIIDYMRSKQGYAGAYIQGPSVHNQRIERLHYDTTHCVLSHFIDLFVYLEENDLLKRDDKLDLFVLHFVFVPRIQKSLEEFQEGWNHHQLSTEGNKTPYQLWLLGMMDGNKAKQRGVRMFHEYCSQEELIGIDPSHSLNVMPDDATIVEVHNIDFENITFVSNCIKIEFDPSTDDGHYGINNYIDVKHRVLELLNN